MFRVFMLPPVASVCACLPCKSSQRWCMQHLLVTCTWRGTFKISRSNLPLSRHHLRNTLRMKPAKTFAQQALSEANKRLPILI